jgi:hypothetical protein
LLAVYERLPWSSAAEIAKIVVGEKSPFTVTTAESSHLRPQTGLGDINRNLLEADFSTA